MRLVTNSFVVLAISLGVTCSATGQTSFSDVTSSLGLGDYRANSGDLHSPGGVFTDLNNDGYADLYLVNSDGASDFNKLYLNTSDGAGGRTFALQSDGSGNDALGAVNTTRTGLNNSGGFTQAANTLSGQNNSNNFRGVTGAVAADYDNDGDTDLYVTNVGGTNRLYQNQLIGGSGLGFVDVTSIAGVSGFSTLPGVGTGTAASASANGSDDSLTATWFDPDRDGDLDLYVGAHHDASDGFPFGGAPDTFYRNNGDGTFQDATAQFSLAGHEEGPNGGFGDFADTNAVVSADINNDGWVDLVVTNKSGPTGSSNNPIDGTQNIAQIYVNQGNDASGDWQGYDNQSFDSTFANSFGNDQVTRSGMGIYLADVDNDGDLDIFISDNPESVGSGDFGSSDLFINQFSETGALSFEHGLVDTGLSWGVQIADFDNDGDVEIHTTNDNDLNDNNGYAALLEFVEGEGALRAFTASDIANPLFQGRLTDTIANADAVDGNGSVLIANVTDIAAASGAGNFEGNGRGNIAADFDRDGKLDLFIVNTNNDLREGEVLDDASVLLLNTTDNANSFLSIELIGNPDDVSDDGFATSRDAIGSRVFVTADIDGDGMDETLIRDILGGAGNAASTSSFDLLFGLGDAEFADITVLWADGRSTDFGSFGTNQFLVLDQAVTSVPEPSSLLIIGLGSLALLRRRRRV